MKKKEYRYPTSQVINFQIEDSILLAASSANAGNPPRWKDGENDWFTDDNMSDKTKSDNYWN